MSSLLSVAAGSRLLTRTSDLCELSSKSCVCNRRRRLAGLCRARSPSCAHRFRVNESSWTRSPPASPRSHSSRFRSPLDTLLSPSFATLQTSIFYSLFCFRSTFLLYKHFHFSFNYFFIQDREKNWYHISSYLIFLFFRIFFHFLSNFFKNY